MMGQGTWDDFRESVADGLAALREEMGHDHGPLVSKMTTRAMQAFLALEAFCQEEGGHGDEPCHATAEIFVEGSTLGDLWGDAILAMKAVANSMELTRDLGGDDADTHHHLRPDDDGEGSTVSLSEAMGAALITQLSEALQVEPIKLGQHMYGVKMSGDDLIRLIASVMSVAPEQVARATETDITRRLSAPDN